MKKTIAISVIALFVSGCMNQQNITSPTAQNSAIAGAIGGAIIAANSGSKSGKRIATGALLGALGAGAAGSAIDGANPKPVTNNGWN